MDFCRSLQRDCVCGALHPWRRRRKWRRTGVRRGGDRSWNDAPCSRASGLSSFGFGVRSGVWLDVSTILFASVRARSALGASCCCVVRERGVTLELRSVLAADWTRGHARTFGSYAPHSLFLFLCLCLGLHTLLPARSRSWSEKGVAEERWRGWSRRRATYMSPALGAAAWVLR